MSRAARRSLLLRELLVPVLAVAGFAPSPPDPGAAQSTPITVTISGRAVAGDGYCSLREALEAAAGDLAVDACPAGSGADVVLLPVGRYGDGFEQLPVEGAVTLRGAGRGATVVFDPIHVRAGATVGLRDLTLSGGGLLNDGHLDARRFEVLRVSIPPLRPSEQRYAVHNRGSMLLVDSEVARNGSSDRCENTGLGPGIGNTGRARLLRSTVRENFGGNEGLSLTNIGAGSSMSVEGGQIGPNSGECVGSGMLGRLENAGTLTVSGTLLRDGIQVQAGARTTIRDSRLDSPGIPALWEPEVTNRGTLRVTGTMLLGLQGVMYNYGSLVLTDTQLVESAGIDNQGQLVMDRSAVVRNHRWPCGTGGLLNRGEALVRSSTFSGNVGATWHPHDCDQPTAAGAVENRGSLTLVWSTLAENRVSGGGSGAGGLSTTAVGSTWLGGTAMARNTAEDDIEGLRPSDCAGPLKSRGANLTEAATDCPLTGAGDRSGTPSGLGPREASLDEAPVHVPQPGSPLIDAAGPHCPAWDARGTPRPRDGDGEGPARCDIGAVEVPRPLSSSLFDTTPPRLPGRAERQPPVIRPGRARCGPRVGDA